MNSLAVQENRSNGIGQSSLLLLSAETLGERLGFSARTIWRLRSAGKLPQPVKIGGSIRWRADEIDEWIRDGCPDMAHWAARAPS